MGIELYIYGIAALAVLGFWIWMLVDAIRRPKFPDKILWVLVIIFTFIVGAVVYFLLIKRQDKKK